MNIKKILLFFFALVLIFSFALTAYASNSITNRLKGRLLLAVEEGGEIWYVNPADLQKYSVTFANALSLFQNLALGITDTDLLKIPVDLDSINPNLDTDHDGYTDRTELQNSYNPYIVNQGKFQIDNILANRLKGKLLLQVNQGGAIWYVDVNGTRHNVRWDNLMDLFERLALGITDKDLAEVGNNKLVCCESYGLGSLMVKCCEKYEWTSAEACVVPKPVVGGGKQVVDDSFCSANWQTYTNERLGYEFQYPNNWQFQFADIMPHFTSPDKKAELFIDENPTQGQIDFIKSDGKFIKEIRTDALVAKLYDYADISGTTSYLLFENKNFVIQFVPHYDTEQYNLIFQKILSTFKFTDETASWTSLKSNYFTLSFKIPSGFEFKEDQDHILVAKSPYFTREIGDDNAFFRITRYNQYDTRESQVALYRKLLKNIKESDVIIDNSSFLKIEGDDWGRFEGDSAGKVSVVFFDASWLEIIERPANSDQSFDPIAIGHQILSTFKFSK